jgi:hypothetical protein
MVAFEGETGIFQVFKKMRESRVGLWGAVAGGYFFYPLINIPKLTH